MKAWKWSDETYDTSVVLLRGDWDTSRAWMDKTFGDVTEAEVGEGKGAKTLWIERPRGTALVLWFPQWFKGATAYELGILAHECFHAAFFVLQRRGVVWSNESDEAFAYYIAWMFRSVLGRLRPETRQCP